MKTISWEQENYMLLLGKTVKNVQPTKELHKLHPCPGAPLGACIETTSKEAINYMLIVSQNVEPIEELQKQHPCPLVKSYRTTS